MHDAIERRIELKTPIARVWRAVSDHREFGAWFKVKLEAPFAVGKEARGTVTHPGYEHVVWKAVVTELTPEKRFAFTWFPYAVDPSQDYSGETPTLVEFLFEDTGNGTLLVIRESGFDKVPANRRDEAFRMNDDGWRQQIKNVEAYIAAHP
jgi:uncharacterized protein YndB with AHSA1/START domain